MSVQFITHAVDYLMDSRNQVAVAVRDSFDNVQRVHQAGLRSELGAQERFRDEWLTTFIFGFGVMGLKKLYNLGMDGLKLFPEHRFDMAVLQAGPGQLTSQRIARYAAQAQKPVLENLLHNQPVTVKLFNKMSLFTAPSRSVYGGFGVFKLLSTSLPAAVLIGIGIPYLNHQLTIRALAKKVAQGDFSGDLATFKATIAQPKAPFTTQQHGAVVLANRLKNSANNTAKTPLQFGSRLAQWTSNLLNNDRLSSALFVDGPLSSLRVITSRNPLEMAEMTIKEVGTIFNLYILADLINKGATSLFTRLTQVSTNLELDTLRQLGQKFLETPEAFAQQMKQLWPSLGLAYSDPDFKTKLVDVLYEQVHNKQVGATTGHWLTDTAIEKGWLPVVQAIEHGKTVLKPNLTQKVEVEALLDFTQSLTQLAENPALAQPGWLKSTLIKSGVGRMGSWVAANAVCYVAMAYLLPKFQHWVSFKRTGEYYFTGIDHKQVEAAKALALNLDTNTRQA